MMIRSSCVNSMTDLTPAFPPSHHHLKLAFHLDHSSTSIPKFARPPTAAFLLSPTEPNSTSFQYLSQVPTTVHLKIEKKNDRTIMKHQ